MKHKITDLDTNQVARYTFDEDHQAQRVIITGGDFGIAEAIKNSLGDITVTADPIDWEKMKDALKELTVQPAPVVSCPGPDVVLPAWPTYIPTQQTIKETEYKILEVPKVVIQKEYEKIEVPVVVKEYQVIQIEKPVIQTITNNDIFFKVLLLINALSTLGLMALEIIKK